VLAASAVAVESVVLDIGGGLGGHAVEWAASPVRPIVVDPSAAMTAAASSRSGVVVVRGRAERLPFADGSIALAYFHLSLHHTDWRKALIEARRVLSADGWIWIWTLGPDHHHRSLLARWFPSIGPLDAARFPDPDAVAGLLRRMGFAALRMGVEIEPVVRTARSWEEAVRAGFVSTLQLLDPREIDEGLAAFRTAHPDDDELIHYRLRYRWLAAGPRLATLDAAPSSRS
jgi:ubiquinone/menaquinone biosynthesis C-methylase UbiE